MLVVFRKETAGDRPAVTREIWFVQRDDTSEILEISEISENFSLPDAPPLASSFVTPLTYRSFRCERAVSRVLARFLRREASIRCLLQATYLARSDLLRRWSNR